MKLTVLGRYGKYPNKEGSTCSYHIQSSGGTNLIVDMGSGSLRNYAKILPYESIDGVILSHFHGDHCADAFVFRNIAFELTKKGVWKSKLPFLMPSEPSAEFQALSGCEGFDVTEISHGLVVRIKDLVIELFKMTHPLPTYGMRITEDTSKKIIAYTADTVYCENLTKLLDGCDLALVDASILSKNYVEGAPHISIADIAKLTKSIPKTVLTHLEYGHEKEAFDEAFAQNTSCSLAVELETIAL